MGSGLSGPGLGFRFGLRAFRPRFRVQGLGSRLLGLRFRGSRVLGPGLRVQVQGLGLGFRARSRVLGLRV